MPLSRCKQNKETIHCTYLVSCIVSRDKEPGSFCYSTITGPEIAELKKYFFLCTPSQTNHKGPKKLHCNLFKCNIFIKLANNFFLYNFFLFLSLKTHLPFLLALLRCTEQDHVVKCFCYC